MGQALLLMHPHLIEPFNCNSRTVTVSIYELFVIFSNEAVHCLICVYINCGEDKLYEIAYRIIAADVLASGTVGAGYEVAVSREFVV